MCVCVCTFVKVSFVGNYFRCTTLADSQIGIAYAPSNIQKSFFNGSGANCNAIGVTEALSAACAQQRYTWCHIVVFSASLPKAAAALPLMHARESPTARARTMPVAHADEPMRMRMRIWVMFTVAVNHARCPSRPCYTVSPSFRERGGRHEAQP